jgi:uncharacterized protein YuzE
MKLHYYKETDSLYIDLSTSVSADSKEIAEGLVVGFDIQHASERIDLTELTAEHLLLIAQVA